MKSAVALAAIAGLTGSFLWASEAAIHGDGLRLCMLWTAAACVTACSRLYSAVRQRRLSQGSGSASDDGRSSEAQQADEGRADPRGTPSSWLRAAASDPVTATLVLVLGLWLATLGVFLREGDRRSALNLCIHWSALAAAAYVLRALVRERIWRVTLPGMVAGACIGLSLLGIWQHHIGYQQYREAFENRYGTATAPASPVTVNTENDRSTTELLRNRVMNSSEPFAVFALTNTLGGVLAAGAILLTALISACLRRRRYFDAAVTACGLMLVVYCLMLTKSRSAWIGTAVGLALLGKQATGLRVSRYLNKRILIGAALIGIPAVLAAVTGSLDREVLLEAPRSLRFRLMYCQGALGVISDFPVLGCGPGNFRQQYLIHRMPEASEAILDPHNVYLDAWCSGGLTALTGVCLLTWCLFQTLSAGSRSELSQQLAEQAGETRHGPRRLVPAGLILGSLMTLGGDIWLADSLTTEHAFRALIPLTAGMLACLGAFQTDGRPASISSAMPEACGAAGAALLIHLLASGGLQIPVLFLLLILLLTVGCADRSRFEFGTSLSDRTMSDRPNHRTGIAGMLASTVAFSATAVMIWVTWTAGIRPVEAARGLTEQAELNSARGRHDAVAEQLTAAVLADPISTDAHSRLVRHRILELRRTVARQAVTEQIPQTVRRDMLQEAETARSRATAAADALVGADRFGLDGYLQRATVRLLQSESESAEGDVSGAAASSESAVADMRKVVSLSPTRALFRARLAMLLADTGLTEEAAAEAEAALNQDDINKQWGHTDQYLAESERQFLAEIVSRRQPGTP